MRKNYNNLISSLKDNQVFVFGSNEVGIQGAGAALVAVNNGWCTKYEKLNNKISLTGKAYGIQTVVRPKVPLPKPIIVENIEKFYKLALDTPNIEYLVAYTKSGKCLNGYTSDEMAVMFYEAAKNMGILPYNIIFEGHFFEQIQKSKPL